MYIHICMCVCTCIYIYTCIYIFMNMSICIEGDEEFSQRYMRFFCRCVGLYWALHKKNLWKFFFYTKGSCCVSQQGPFVIYTRIYNIYTYIHIYIQKFMEIFFLYKGVLLRISGCISNGVMQCCKCWSWWKKQKHSHLSRFSVYTCMIVYIYININVRV